MNYLSLACIAKNEDSYIEEWVNFHRAVGIEHFYIYDNDSKVPINLLLKKYIEFGIVTVINFPGKLMQHPAYQHCLNNFGKDNKWIGFIDCDEFLVPKSNNTISEILLDYENFGGLAVNWLFFGSSGFVKKPNGLVTENFIMASHKDWCTNRHIKSIVQPEKTKSIGGDPHWFKYKEPFYAVSENYLRVDGSVLFDCNECNPIPVPEGHHFGMINTNKIQLHHYYNKSEEEFMIRHYGGSAWDKSLTRNNMDGFNNINRLCNLENKTALKFVEQTKSLYIK